MPSFATASGCVGNCAALVDIFDLQRAPVTWFDDLSLAGEGVEWADKLERILAPLGRPGNVLFNFPKMYSNGARSCEVAVSVQLDSYVARVVDREISELGSKVRNPSAVKRWMSGIAANTKSI
jgi:hypothetical protein